MLLARALIAPLFATLACGLATGCDAGPGALPVDGAAPDVSPVDVGPDAAPADGFPPPADAALDAEPDALVDGAPEIGPDTVECPIVPSPRPPETLRTAGCRVVERGEAATLPRVVAVSGDSLERASATPLHAPRHWADLARAGVDVVWMVALWSGIEPARETYNGAYSARLCQSVGEASDAGLSVVLAMTQHRFGPALGGHGMPDWVVPDGLAPVPEDAAPGHPSLAAAWQAFWDADDRSGPAGLEAAWTRLIETCAQDEVPGIIGLSVLGAPIGRADDLAHFAALSDRVEAAAEQRLGPLLRFEHGLWVDGELRWTDRPGPDRVRVVPGFGPGRWPGAAPLDGPWLADLRASALLAGRPLWAVGVGGLHGPALAEARSAVEGAGLVPVIWQDGFGTPYGLRDAEGRPAALWAPALDGPRPVMIAGRPTGWRSDDEALTVSWIADGSAQGLSRINMAGRPVGDVTLLPDDTGIEWFTDYDPVTDLLAVFVQGAAGEVALTVRTDAP